jgi:hypothetical protein
MPLTALLGGVLNFESSVAMALNSDLSSAATPATLPKE